MNTTKETFKVVIIREDGILKTGAKLIVNSEISGYSELDRNREYTISEVKEVFKMDAVKSMIYVSLKEFPNNEYSSSIFSIVPTKFNVYRWKGYYILAVSEEQAQRIWNTWIDNLEIEAADGRPKLFKFVNNLINRGDQELFPRAIKRLHTEYPFPCIIEDLNFEKEPVYIYRFPE